MYFKGPTESGKSSQTRNRNKRKVSSEKMKELAAAMGNGTQEPSAEESALLSLAHNEDVWLQVLMLLPPDSVANVSYLNQVYDGIEKLSLR